MADAFDDISDIIQSMDREKAIANVNAGPELPPDTAGEADQLSRRTGLPPAAVAADMDGIKAEQSAAANREIVNGNPAIQTYIAGNPIAASASHDDLPALDKASKSWGLWNNLGAGWESGVLSEKRANMFEVGDSEGVRAATARMQALQSDALSFKAANMVSGLLSNLSAASPAAGVVGLAGAAAGTVAAPGPGTAIGGMAAYGAALASGMSIDAGRVAGINHFIDSGEAKDENGNPFSIPARVAGALVTGILTTALFRLGGEGVSAPLGEMASDAVSKAMESSVVAGIASRTALLLARQGLEFGAINGAMSAVDSFATELEKQVSPGHFRTIFNDPATRDDMIKRTYSAIGDGILLGGALGAAHGVVRLPGIGVNMVADHMRTVQIERDLEAFSNNLNDVQSTKTFQRSPELMQEFLESHQDAPKQVWMPAETALKLGFDVDPKLAELGQDISVPATEYLTKVDPAKHEEVKGDLRFSEDGVSKNEADELKKVEPVQPEEDVTPIEGTEPPVTDLPARELAVIPEELHGEEAPASAGRDLVELTKLATDENKKAMWLQRFFANAKAMKMTGPVFAAWSKALERADKAEQQKIYSAGVREAKRRLGKQWKDETAATKDEVTTELNARPDWAAESRLTEKGGIKLDKDFVDEVYHPDLYEDGWTKEPSAALDPAMFDKTTGLHPDDVANLVGYSSGREMVRDLMRLAKERQDSGEGRQVYQDRKINEETTRRVEDKLGKFEEKVEEVARQAVATDGRMDVLTKETEWLGAQHGFPLDKEKMEAQVKTSFARKPVDGAVAIKAWEKQVGKWGAAAEKALLQGKGPEAFKFKQNQLYSLMFLKEAMALKNDLEAFKKISDRFTKTELPPGIHSEYNDHIQDILRKLGFDMKRAASDLDAKIGGDPDALQKFITRENNGKLRDIQVDGIVPTLRGAGINKLEVHQFGKLYDGLRSLITNGRIAQAMEVGGRKVEFGVLAKQAIDNLKSFGDKPFTKEMDQGFKHILRAADSMLMQLERLFRRWDKGDKFGPFQTVMQRIQNAKQAEAKWRADGDKFFRSVNFDTRDLGRDAINKKLHETDDFGGDLRKMTKADVLGLAIHMGNEDNLYHLVEGMNSRIKDAGKKWTEAAVKETVFKNLKPEDWNKIQQVWNKFAERWPELQELNWRTRGFAPPEIKPQELKLPTGETLKGGYFPLRKDYYRGDPLKVEVEGPGDEERYYRTQTAQSASELRTGALYPLNLSINDAKFAYLDMGHDVTHREAIRDAVTFFNQAGLMQAIDRSQGKEYSRLIPDYLKEVSGPAGRNEVYGQSNMMDRLADKARLNWTLATLLGRFSTFSKHFPSVASYSVNEVGLRPTISAFTKLYANSPSGAGKIHDFVTENSKEVQFRYSQHDRDLRELQENQFGEPGYSYKATQIAGWLMAAGDNATAKMVWLAEYEKQVAEHGHEKAAELGDVAVRRTHPTGALQDLPAIMRGRGVKKLLTMAYSFFSMSYNNMRETGWQAQEAYKMVGDGDLKGGMDKGFQVMARMFWTMTMAGTIESLVSPRHNQDKESWLGWTGRNTMMPLLASFPLIRDMVKAIEFKGNLDTVDFGPQGTFLRNTFDTLQNAYKLTQHKQTSKKAVQHLIAAPSIFLPMPGAEQVGATSQGLSDVMRHKTHPKGMGDWLSILTLGHPAKGH